MPVNTTYNGEAFSNDSRARPFAALRPAFRVKLLPFLAAGLRPMARSESAIPSNLTGQFSSRSSVGQAEPERPVVNDCLKTAQVETFCRTGAG